MAEYSTNYTSNTTDKTFGTETYKFSRTVDVINPSAIDNSCIYCGAENGSMYDYYPTYNLGTAEKAIMNNKWSASGGTFNFQKSATPTPYNITFVKCGESGTADERGRNTVYQIGKTIYNKATSATNSSMRVLNPTDIRKLIFRPKFYGYTASPSSTYTEVDLKYIMDHPDDFFVQDMSMNVYAWNGSTFTNDSEIQSIRPCIVGENYFIPVNNVLGRHIFGMTDYNSRRDYTQSFYGTYDDDNMPMSFVPILTDETLTYDPNGSSGGSATPNHNKWKWSYNSYNSSYEIHAPARQVLQLMAYCGCYFIDNSYSTSGKTLNTMWNDEHIYLGEMKEGARTTGNFIKGTELLTSDTINKGAYSSQTDFDPSGGGGSAGDDFDGMTTGFSNNIGGAAKYWLLPSDPSGLFEDFFLHAPQGSSITQNILSCYVSALKHDWQTVAHKMVIYTNGSQKPAFESQNTYEYMYQSNPHKVLGVFNVPRKTNTFYDFSPYSTYEVYIPFCGWIGLPDIVAGRRIRVYMDFDASICTCKARVECEDNDKNVIVGEISGTFGSPCPIQVTEGGLYRQAAINSALQIASGVASGTLGAATKHGGPLAIGGFSYALQGLTNAATAGNTNYSQTIGRSGDSSNLAGTSHYCYLRITHPEIDEVVNNTRFGHTVGYLCNTIGKIGDFEGFTVCGNPHVTGIACSESEKEEIKRMLEDGIIVNKVE